MSDDAGRIGEGGASLDITGETCPMTFVRTRLALDRLPPGARLEVRLRGEEPRRNVTDQVTALGHVVEMQTALEDGVWRLDLRKT